MKLTIIFTILGFIALVVAALHSIAIKPFTKDDILSSFSYVEMSPIVTTETLNIKRISIGGHVYTYMKDSKLNIEVFTKEK